VPLYHVDALGIVWHGRYYEYLEHARIRLLRARRLDASQLLELGFGMLLIESRCRHVAPLRYGDRIRVSAWLRDTKYRLHVQYEITNLTQGQSAARAHTILVTTDPTGRLLLRTPEAILERLLPDEGPQP
jgi:acyl-CoA thioester hydrolase